MDRSRRFVPRESAAPPPSQPPSGARARPRSLATWIEHNGRLNRVAAVGWAIRLCKTLEPMHRRGTAHGGVCAEAVMALSPNPSEHAELVVVEPLRAPIAYFSPERLSDDRPSTVQDVWATGVLLYFLITGQLPFPGRSRREVRTAVLCVPPPPLLRFGVADPELQALIDRTLAPRLASRIVRASALREALESWRPALALDNLDALESVHGASPDGASLPPPRAPRPRAKQPSDPPTPVERSGTVILPPPAQLIPECDVELDGDSDDGDDDPDTLELELPKKPASPPSSRRAPVELAATEPAPSAPCEPRSPAAEAAPSARAAVELIAALEKALGAPAAQRAARSVPPREPPMVRSALIAVGVVLCAQAVGLALAWAFLG